MSQGRGHRRGHNRSGGWTQIPQIPSVVATSAPGEKESQQEPSQPDHPSEQTNGQVPGWTLASAASAAHHHHRTPSHSHNHSHTSLSDGHLLGDTSATTTRADEKVDCFLGSSGSSASFVTPFQSSGSDVSLR